MLSENALIVKLNVTCAPLSKKEEDIARSASQTFNIDQRNVSSYKKLYNPEDTKALVSAYGNIRTFHYRYTLPWSQGEAFISASQFDFYNSEINRLGQEYLKLANEFCDNIQGIIARAIASNGDLGKRSDYKKLHSLRERFSFDVNYFAIPENDIRASISQIEKDKIIAREKSRQDIIIQEAKEKLAKDILTFVTDLNSRMQDKKGKGLHQSTLDKAQHFSNMLDSFNFLDSELFGQLKNELTKISGYDKNEIQDSEQTKKEFAKRTKDVLDKIDSYL